MQILGFLVIYYPKANTFAIINPRISCQKMLATLLKLIKTKGNFGRTEYHTSELNLKYFFLIVNPNSLVCNDDDDDDDEVCATNGVTYSSLCRLLQDTGNEAVAYAGECDREECRGGKVSNDSRFNTYCKPISLEFPVIKIVCTKPEFANH